MTDTKHVEQKEAIEDLMNRTGVYRGVQVAIATLTSTAGYVTHDDGTITGPSFKGGLTVSNKVKALIDASLDAKPPVVVDPPPVVVDPPPVVVDPPPVVSISFNAKISATGVIVVQDTSANVPTNAAGGVTFGDNYGAQGIRLGNTVSYAYKAQGPYAVTLKWKDSAGTSYSATGVMVHDGTAHAITSDAGTIISVGMPPAPPPTPGPPPLPPPPKDLSVHSRILAAGLTAFAIDTSTPTTGKIITSTVYDWNDNTPPQTAAQPTFTSSNMRFAQHTFDKAGTYYTSQVTTDSSGASQTVMQTVCVVALPDAVVVGEPDTVTVVGAIAGDIPVNLVLSKGDCKAMIPGKLTGSVIYHADGKSTCLENMLAGFTDDLFGVFTVYAGDKVMFSGPLNIWAGRRTRPFWIIQPQVDASADLSIFPNYPKGSGQETMYAQYMASDNSPMGIANPGMGSTAIGDGGEHSRLGATPEWDADALVNPTAENAIVVRGMADSCAPFVGGVRDPVTMKMLDVTQFPRASMLGVQLGGPGNPIGKYQTVCPTSIDQAQTHAVVFNALACRMFGGTDYDKEQLAFWCNHVNSLYQNWSYRLKEGCTGTAGIARATGRGMVVLSYASLLSDHPEYFKKWMLATLADFTTVYKDQVGIQTATFDGGYPNHGFGPWLQHLLIYGIGCSMKHGYVNPDSQFALDHFAVPVLDSMLVTQMELSTVYNSTSANSAGARAKDWAESLAFTAVNQPHIAAALKCEEGSQALADALGESGKPGWYSGYPTSPEGRAAILQTALAVIKDFGSDKVRANAAWDKFAATAMPVIRNEINKKYAVLPKRVT